MLVTLMSSILDSPTHSVKSTIVVLHILPTVSICGLFLARIGYEFGQTSYAKPGTASLEMIQQKPLPLIS